jgi:hypothetical protein
MYLFKKIEGGVWRFKNAIATSKPFHTLHHSLVNLASPWKNDLKSSPTQFFFAIL